MFTANWVWFIFLCDLVFSSELKKLNILLFGGNGFIGSECAHALLTERHNLTLINRGTNYYDYETRIKPFVTAFECDRYYGLQNCEYLHNVQYFDFIIDFSAYEPSVIAYALYHLDGKFGTYIYISTDSVYEVCQNSSNKKSKETDSQRPTSIEQQTILNKKDEYGHYKLEAEEMLVSTIQLTKSKYVIVRLPDVFGPRDTTYRWWAYQTLLKFYSKKVVYLPKQMQKFTTSYVYVKDVARLLTTIVTNIAVGDHSVENQVFNLAFPSEINLRTLMDSLQKALGVQGVEYKYHEDANYLYPSVTRGSIDVTKVHDMLQFVATPWEQAVKETVIFFNKSFCQFVNERTKMLEKLYMIMTIEEFPVLEKKLHKMIEKCDSSRFHEEL